MEGEFGRGRTVAVILSPHMRRAAHPRMIKKPHHAWHGLPAHVPRYSAASAGTPGNQRRARRSRLSRREARSTLAGSIGVPIEIAVCREHGLVAHATMFSDQAFPRIWPVRRVGLILRGTS